MTSTHPFLRWPGGKRLLAPQIVAQFPDDFSTYYEPFCGSAAVLFRLRPEKAVLGDLSPELIETYLAIQRDVEAVIEWLKDRKQDARSYYAIRKMQPRSEAGRAGRFVYLNRLAFNGIWRVNQEGKFNVPYGYRPRSDLVTEQALRHVAQLLRRVRLVQGDFDETLKNVRSRSLVYADPPYTLAHGSNGFRKYNERLFSWEDQERLANRARLLADRGVFVCVSNAAHVSVRRLYSGFREIELSKHVSIAGSVTARKAGVESLFLSW